MFALGAGVATGFVLTYLQDMPHVRDLENFRPMESSYVYAADGSLLHEFAAERRIFIPYAEIPRPFIEAVIATEDSRFFEHWGVDFAGIGRALIRNLRARSIVEGGSTITQQLAKVLFLTREQTLRRKVQDIVLAFQIERRYSKERILELYANQVYMGSGVYGLEAAAGYYFGKEAKELAICETAMLAGLIRNPGRYNPFKHPERASARKRIVLRRMVSEDYLTPEEAERIAKESLSLRKRAPQVTAVDYFVEEVRKTLARRFSAEEIFGGGMRIRTTLDPELQRWAEEALHEGLRSLDKKFGVYRGPEENVLAEPLELDAYEDPSWKAFSPLKRGGGVELKEGDIVRALVLDAARSRVALRVGEREGTLDRFGAAWAKTRDFQKILKRGDIILVRVESISKDGALQAALEQDPEVQGAFLALDPAVGAVRAMVGGYRFEESQFNRALQARRQTGSAFKPIIYASAFEQGYTPSDVLLDEPTVFFDRGSGVPYFPENHERDFKGITTLRRALELSRNVVTVRLLNRIGIHRLIDAAKRFGFRGPFQPYPSLALGASEATLEEMVSAFASFANGGTRAAPHWITRIESPISGEMEEFFPRFSRVISPEVAYVMAQVLRGVVLRGTAYRASGLRGEVAGKTGTTNAYTDAWFVGFTPDLAAGMWVGYDTKRSMGRGMVGARVALPIWMEFMKKVLARSDEPSQLKRPPRVVRVPVDPKTGLRATLESRCTDIFLETFVEGTEPQKICSESAHRLLELSWKEQRRAVLSGEAPFFAKALLLQAPHAGETLRFFHVLQGEEEEEKEEEEKEEDSKREEEIRREINRVRSRLFAGIPVAVEAVVQ
jgi:penicillin-binding protein 1A